MEWKTLNIKKFGAKTVLLEDVSQQRMSLSSRLFIVTMYEPDYSLIDNKNQSFEVLFK